MSKWSHADGSIYCRNMEGVKTLLASQKKNEKPWVYYETPYNSLRGSEGAAHFEYDKDKRVLNLSGDLRDVGTIPEEKEELVEDFKKIIKLVDGSGYIELEYEYEGTIVVDYYVRFETRIFPKADGWNKWFDWKKKEGLI